MIKYNIRVFAYAILGLGIITFLVIFLFISKDLLSSFSSAVAFNIIIWTLFINWAWKFKIFYPWLVPFPNLSGKWEGELISNWDNKSLDPIPTKVIINQTFFNVQVQIQTGESKSFSTGASFDIDTDRGLQQLFYSYLNTPKPSVRERSEIHYGTTRLEFKGFKVDELEGEYWTSRETTGELHLKRKR
ncbi:hypothetical protein [Polaribacter cellanae]|uniref:CD-NTase-associated protein 15 domain-containing protein n=1 Tax=Polaribacter cellanae TaxID=2818493 RepID=A0A975CKP8_9FLAO|nr:hypothetical protein [Polaribacter cellanae]QTE21094.1 hypothetical protein J3359_09550 [Polaribacter cellanae]